MGVEKAVSQILLQVGAEVDEAAFNKVSGVLKKRATEISKNITSIEPAIEGTKKTLNAFFTEAVPAKDIDRMGNAIRNVFKAIGAGVSSESSINSLMEALSKVMLDVAKNAEMAASSTEKLLEKASKYKAINDAASFYGKQYGSDKYADSSVIKSLSTFTHQLLTTGNALRAIDPKKYEGWEKTADFSKLQEAIVSGVIKGTSSGFIGTGLNQNKAYSALGIDPSTQAAYDRLSGIKSFKVLQEDLDSTITKFSKEVGAKFANSFGNMATTFGQETEKVKVWYKQLEKAAAFMSNLPKSTTATQATKDAVAGVTPYKIGQGLMTGSLKIINGDLQVYNEAGLKALKITEEFAKANGLLNKSFSDNKIIKEISDKYGYSEDVIKKAMRSVRKEANDMANSSGKSYREVISSINIFESTVSKLTTKPQKFDVFKDSSESLKKAMATLNNSGLTAGTKAFNDYKAAISAVEQVVNKTASKMTIMGENGDAFRKNADLYSLATQKLNGSLQATGGVMDDVRDRWQKFNKSQTTAQQANEALSKKYEQTGISQKAITNAVSSAVKEKDAAILRANAGLVAANVAEDRRTEILKRINDGLNLQEIAERKLLDVQTKRAATSSNLYSSSSPATQQGWKELNSMMSSSGIVEGTKEYKKWVAAFESGEKYIDNQRKLLNSLGLEGDKLVGTYNRMAAAEDFYHKGGVNVKNDLQEITLKARGLTNVHADLAKEIDRTTLKYGAFSDPIKAAIKSLNDLAVAGSKPMDLNEYKKLVTEIKKSDEIIKNTANALNRAGLDSSKFTDQTSRLEYAQKSLRGELGRAKKGVDAEADAMIKASQKADIFASVLSSIWTKFKTLSQYATAGSMIYGIQNAFRGGVSVVLEYDQALHNLQAIIGANSVEMGILGEKIIDLASNTRFSVKEIADGMTILGQAGFTAKETLSSIDSIVALSAATLSDLSSTVELVTSAMGAFELESTEAGRVTDIFASAINKSKLNLDKLKTAFNYVGPIAHNAGISLEETATMMAFMSNSGIRASTIGTSLRQVIDKLLNPTKSLSEAIAKAGYTVDDFDPKLVGIEKVLQRLAVIVPDSGKALEYFGNRGASAISVLTNVTTEEFAKLEETLTRSGSVFEMQAIQMEGAVSKQKNLMDNLGVLAVKFGNLGFTEVFKESTDILTEFIKGLGAFNENHPVAGGFLGFFAKAGAAVVALTGASMVLKAVLSTQLWTTILASSPIFSAFVASMDAATVSTVGFTAAATTAGTAIRGFLSFFGNPWVLGIGAALYVLSSAASEFGLFDTAVEKSYRSIKENNEALKEQEEHEIAMKKAVELNTTKVKSLTDIAKDNTRTLGERKEAVNSLIDAGVNFDRSLIDNIDSVEEFNKALVDGGRYIDDYINKMNDALDTNRRRTIQQTFRNYDVNSKFFAENAGATKTEYYGSDDMWGLDGGIEVADEETRKKAAESNEQMEKDIDTIRSYFSEFKKLPETQVMFKGFVSAIADGSMTISDANKKIQLSFETWAKEKHTDKITDSVQLLIDGMKAINIQDVVKKHASDISTLEEANEKSLSALTKKGQMSTDEFTSNLSSVADTTKERLATLSDQYRIEVASVLQTNESFKDKTRQEIDEMARNFVSGSDEILKSLDMGGVESLQEIRKAFTAKAEVTVQGLEDNARKVYSAYKKIKDAERARQKIEDETELAEITKKYADQGAAGEIAIAKAKREIEERSAKRLATSAHELVDFINSQPSLAQIKNTTFWNELLDEMKGETRDIAQAQADLAVSMYSANKKLVREGTAELKKEVKAAKSEYSLNISTFKRQQEEEIRDLDFTAISNKESAEKNKYEITRKYIKLQIIEVQKLIDKLKELGASENDINDAASKLNDLTGDLAGVDADQKYDTANLDFDAKKQTIDNMHQTEMLGKIRGGFDTTMDELNYQHDQEINAVREKYAKIGGLTEQGQAQIASIEAKYNMLRKNAEDQMMATKYAQYGEFYGGMSDLMGEFYTATGEKMKAFLVFQKALAIAQIIMDTASQAAKVGAQTGIFGIPMQALIMAQGAARAGMVAGTTIAELSMAEGGKVPGYSPTPTADNIPANLTAGEFVMPVNSVSHYGDNAMEAIRTRAIPKEVLSQYAKNNAKTSSSHFSEGGKAVPSDNNGDPGEKVSIVNILDPSMFDQYVASHAGQKTLKNFISRNPQVIKRALQS